MRYVLNLIYVVLLIVAAPWLIVSAWKRGKYRAGWCEKFLGRVPMMGSSGTGSRVWLHAVSVGEVNLLPPLLRELSRRRPDMDFAISTTTRTGYELARRLFPDRCVFYCPLDFSWAVDEAMRRVRPDMLVLVELELWPNLIAAAKRRGVRVAVVNGRLSDRSSRGYRRIARLLANTLRRIDLYAVQNDEYAQRFMQIGAPADRVVVTGSMKFDGARTDRANEATSRLNGLAGFSDRDLVFLAGSTQAPEEQMAIDCFQRLSGIYPELRLILVPRHAERFEEVAGILDAAGVAWQRRSRLGHEGASPSKGDARILLVDTIGELGAWWGAADIGFVGGSMGSRGGQNMIEPAAYGVAVSFGPNTWNFRDIVAMLLQHEAAVIVRDQSELEAFVLRALAKPAFRQTLGQRAAQLVQTQLGAAAMTVDRLETLLPQPLAGPHRSNAA